MATIKDRYILEIDTKSATASIDALNKKISTIGGGAATAGINNLKAALAGLNAGNVSASLAAIKSSIDNLATGNAIKNVNNLKSALNGLGANTDGINKVKASLNGLGSSSALGGLDKIKAALAGLNAGDAIGSISSLKNTLGTLGNSGGGIGTIISMLGRLATSAALAVTAIAAVIVVTVAAGVALVNASRASSQLEQQLRLVTSGSADLSNVMAQLQDISSRTATSIGSNVQLYGKVALATSDMGKSQREVLKFTEQFAKALAISGADAGTAAGAITQLGQAMSGGVIRGDEFNSISEALGPALSIIAKDAGLTRGELKKLADSGQLTSDAFFKMVTDSDALSNSFDKMGFTAAQMETKLGGAFDRLVMATATFVDNIFNISGAYKSVLGGVTSALEGISSYIEKYNLRVEVETAVITPQNLDEVAAQFENITDSASGSLAVVDEIQRRIDELTSQKDSWNPFADSNEELQKKIDYYTQLQALAVNMAAQDVQGTSPEGIKALLAPYADLTARLKDYYAANDALTAPLDKVHAAQAQAAADLDTLNGLVGTQAGDAFPNLAEAIAATEQRYKALGAEATVLEEKMSGMTLGTFFKNLIDSSKEIVDATQLAQWSLEDLSTALANEAISPEVYAVALEKLNTQLGIPNLQTYTEFAKDLNNQMAVSANTTEMQSTAIDGLNVLFANGVIGLEYYTNAISRLGTTFEQQMVQTNNMAGYLENLMATVDKTVATDKFKAEAVGIISQQMNAGTITTEQYEAAMAALGQTVTSNVDRMKSLKESNDSFIQSMTDGVSSAQDEFNRLSMTPLQREIDTTTKSIERSLAAQKRALIEARTTSNAGAIDTEIARITAAASSAIKSQADLATRSYQYQRSFAAGWKDAFQEYKDSAEDASQFGRDLFAVATSGMEDLLYKFVTTGKFQWKDYAASIADAMLKSSIKQLTSKMFGGISSLLGIDLGGAMGPATGTQSDPMYVVPLTGGFDAGLMGQGVSQALGPQFTGLGNSMKGSIGGLGNILTSGLGGLGGMLGNAIGGMGNMFSGLFSGLGGGGGGGLFSGLFGGIGNIFGGLFGGIKSLFGGFFATGGQIPSGKFGIVGEKGPEFIGGPANITPMAAIAPQAPASYTQVVYNISAVDARSFQELIARDPKFIHAVAEKGRQNLVGVRR